ncbi:cytochrome P450 [Nocardia tenerifensis]|uniref:Cytochrome P450 n=1 Tax=Nocardia tenerifensis TaxID=228006 RepID=A0A318K013_9NOCA|nr:cytochrome P450 [Nocardia tenerifensis]PXX60962.1 cytochrome P450 [Nocardia tenerifensis]
MNDDRAEKFEQLDHGRSGVLGLGTTLRWFHDPLAVMQRLAGEHGPVAGFRIGLFPAVLVTGPTEINEVLVSRAADFRRARAVTGTLWPALREGLIISEGEVHRAQRAMVAPLFTARRVPKYVDVMVARMQKHVRTWQAAGELDLLAGVQAMMHDVVAGLLIDEPLEDHLDVVDAATRIFDWEMRAMSRPIVAPLNIPTKRNRDFIRDLALVRDWAARMIDARRRHPDRHDDIVSAMLAQRDRDGAPMSEERLVDEVLNLWAAAHETSADAMFWTAYALSRHPGIAERAGAEVDRVLGGATPTAEDLAQLPYCLQVFKESMRLYPPSPAFLREAACETRIGDYAIAENTIVFIAPYVMHRSALQYPDPERFDPDRFAQEADRSWERLSYLPFGAGEHVCIGSALALLEGQIFTALLLGGGTLRIDRDMAMKLTINLRPKREARAVYVPRRRSGRDLSRIEAGEPR